MKKFWLKKERNDGYQSKSGNRNSKDIELWNHGPGSSNLDCGLFHKRAGHDGPTDISDSIHRAHSVQPH